MTLRFRNVIIDVDSTLCGIEGIDWLAALRGDEIARRSRALTDASMSGEIPVHAVYGERLSFIRPSRTDIEALAAEYRATVAPGAPQAIADMTAAGARVVLVSGGLQPAIAPLARDLGVELHAVDVYFDADGVYAGYDTTSPLSTQSGKLQVVRELRLDGSVLAVGDGVTDASMRAAVDRFVAFTGFVQRASVIAQAHGTLSTFAELLAEVVHGDARTAL